MVKRISEDSLLFLVVMVVICVGSVSNTSFNANPNEAYLERVKLSVEPSAVDATVDDLESLASLADPNHRQHAQQPPPECHLRPVVHILQHPGCIPKPIPSFACYGTCSSYVQVSNSKFWQVERSCNCCQEIGEREASVSLYCPKQTPKYRKVTTRAPVDCMCRPCTAVDEHQIKPLELHDTNSG